MENHTVTPTDQKIIAMCLAFCATYFEPTSADGVKELFEKLFPSVDMSKLVIVNKSFTRGSFERLMEDIMKVSENIQ